ncbi:MAG: substrate-binding domain-containing protein [Solirubrobacteraceae bacterium]|nr:substrate-binding domain-containing protein [Patulibacter sp.]
MPHLKISSKRAVAAVAASVLLAGVPASAASAKTKAETITISGATGSAPLVALLAKKYYSLHPKDVKFKLSQGGGEVGVQDAAAGRVTIGNGGRDPRPSDPAGLVWTPIARDYFTFITNPANKLPNLTQAVATQIWTRQITDWSQVPGSTITGPINLIGRTSASSQPALVQSIFLGGKAPSSTVSQKASDSLVRQAVASDKQAIGYASGWYTQQGDVNPVAFNGVAPSPATAKSGQFAGVRTYYEITLGKPTGQAAKFISWIVKAPAARKIIASYWVPLT